MSRLMQEKRREGQRQGMLPADKAQDGKHILYVDEQGENQIWLIPK